MRESAVKTTSQAGTLQRKKDSCVLPSEVNPKVVAKADTSVGDKRIAYYDKCPLCGSLKIVFHPCIHQWICFGCRRSFGWK